MIRPQHSATIHCGQNLSYPALPCPALEGLSDYFKWIKFCIQKLNECLQSNPLTCSSHPAKQTLQYWREFVENMSMECGWAHITGLSTTGLVIIIGMDRVTKSTGPPTIKIKRDKGRLQKSPKGRRSGPNLFISTASFLKPPVWG